MNKLFYFRLAAQNLRKNGKFYIPYLLAGIGNVMMFYIMVYLRTNPAMENTNLSELFSDSERSL